MGVNLAHVHSARTRTDAWVDRAIAFAMCPAPLVVALWFCGSELILYFAEGPLLLDSPS